MSRKLFVIILSVFVAVTIFGCKLQHSHFEFDIDDFKNVPEEHYATEKTLEKYKVGGIVIRPWIKETTHDLYEIGVYGYSEGPVNSEGIYIHSISLSKQEGCALITASNCDLVILPSNDDLHAKFVHERVASFSGDEATVGDHEILEFKILVSTDGKAKGNIKEILYKIHVREYLTYSMPT